MKKLIAICILFVSTHAFAETLQQCLNRADARHHSRTSQARQEFLNRRENCRNLPVPDRVTQCISAARGSYENRMHESREQHSLERRACRNPS
jgi:hypothetical protein